MRKYDCYNEIKLLLSGVVFIIKGILYVGTGLEVIAGCVLVKTSNVFITY